MSKQHIKVRVKDITLDARYQRDLDQKRAASMAKSIDLARIGVPVAVRRKDGKLVVVDGQHRVSALMQAGMGAEQILVEIHEGLTLQEEATLFLKLNDGRKAVGAYDKFRAELVAKDTTALEIERILASVGLRLARAPGSKSICAINAVRGVHTARRNLRETLFVINRWAEGDPLALSGEMIKNISYFLSKYPDANLEHLAKKLAPHSPDRVLARISRSTSVRDNMQTWKAACVVLREIYNHKARTRLQPLHMVLDGTPEEYGEAAE